MLSELEQAAASSQAVESGVRPVRSAEDDLPESLRLAERRTWVLGVLLAVALALVLALVLVVWRRPGAVRAASQPATPTVAPLVASESTNALALENSASIAAPLAPAEAASEPMASTSGSAIAPRATALPVKKPKSKPASPLERKGNERYGRFD
jgi:hypothetical protein